MISRRTILAWLGLAPFAIAAMKLPAVAQPTVQAAGVIPRTRGWKMVLEADGSTALAKDGERYLTSWLSAQNKDEWASLDKMAYEEAKDRLEHAKFYQNADISIRSNVGLKPVWIDAGTDFMFKEYETLDEAVAAKERVLREFTPTNTLGVIENIVNGDIEAVKERSNPWRELKEFEEKYKREVPIESKIYGPGSVLEQDVAHYCVGEDRVRYFSGELMESDEIQGPWLGMGRRYYYGPETAVYKMANGL